LQGSKIADVFQNPRIGNKRNSFLFHHDDTMDRYLPIIAAAFYRFYLTEEQKKSVVQINNGNEKNDSQNLFWLSKELKY
jgi:hypothetical protein